jgi:hypothetical protein
MFEPMLALPQRAGTDGGFCGLETCHDRISRRIPDHVEPGLDASQRAGLDVRGDLLRIEVARAAGIGGVRVGDAQRGGTRAERPVTE